MKMRKLRVVTVELDGLEKCKEIALMASNMQRERMIESFHFRPWGNAVVISHFVTSDSYENVEKAMKHWGEIDEEDTEYKMLAIVGMDDLKKEISTELYNRHREVDESDDYVWDVKFSEE